MTNSQIHKKVEDLFGVLETLELELVSVYSRQIALESKFKPMLSQKQVSFLTSGKNGFDAKIFAENLLANEEDYGEYLSLPYQIEKLTKLLRIAELKLKSLDKMLETAKISRL